MSLRCKMQYNFKYKYILPCLHLNCCCFVCLDISLSGTIGVNRSRICLITRKYLIIDLVIIYVKSDCHLAKSLISLSRTIAVIRYMNLSLYAKISGLVIMQEKSDFLMAEDTTFKYIEGKFILKVD